MVETEKLEKLMEIIKNSSSTVFFGGAGVSTASNIPDFRSDKGLFKNNPEKILSRSFYVKHPKEFYEFYFNNMIYKDALPNECHKFLAKLEEDDKLNLVVTQNIDGLHQKAGSKKVIELHGSVYRNYCIKCRRFYELNDYIFDQFEKNIVPRCECGGVIKPDVVLYEELLNMDNLYKATNAIANCETLIVGGTSLVVTPASNLIKYFKGKNLIVINKGPQAMFSGINLYINGKIEDYLNIENYNKYLK